MSPCCPARLSNGFWIFRCLKCSFRIMQPGDENPIINTKVTNLIVFCLKCYHVLVDKNVVWYCQMSVILDFSHNAMVKLLSDYTTWKTNHRHQNRDLILFSQFIVLTFYKWRLSWILLTIQSVMCVLPTPLCQAYLKFLWYTQKSWLCFFFCRK